MHVEEVQLQKLKHFAKLVESEFIADLGYFLTQAVVAIESKTMTVSNAVTKMGQYQVDAIDNGVSLPYGSCDCIVDGKHVYVEPHLAFLI